MYITCKQRALFLHSFIMVCGRESASFPFNICLTAKHTVCSVFGAGTFSFPNFHSSRYFCFICVKKRLLLGTAHRAVFSNQISRPTPHSVPFYFLINVLTVSLNELPLVLWVMHSLTVHTVSYCWKPT